MWKVLPGLFFESRGRVGLMDPWESPYHIILNANPDDRTPRVQVGSRMVTRTWPFTASARTSRAARRMATSTIRK